MPATLADVRADAALIGNETQIGANTASRVGGAFNDVADVLDALGITSITATADTSNLTITITQGATAHNVTMPIATATKVGILNPANITTIDGNSLASGGNLPLKTIDGYRIIGNGDIDITRPILAMLNNYQRLLQSGVNIKTLEGESLLGAGNISLSAVFAAALAAYQPLLESGTNIKTINGQSLVGSGNINIEEGGQIDTSGFATLNTALGQLQYSQTPVIVLASMGNTMDNVDITQPPYIAYNPNVGDTYYDPTGKKIHLVKHGGDEVYSPAERLIYCNAASNRLYRWRQANQTWYEVGSKANNQGITLLATNVIYNNANTQMSSANVQDAIDELYGEFVSVYNMAYGAVQRAALATINSSPLYMGGNIETFIVGVIEYSGGVYSCDRTFADLYQKSSDGSVIAVVYNDDVYQLSGVTMHSLTFTSGNSSFMVSDADAWSYTASTFAPIFSPAFTGTPTAPTANVLTSNDQIATTQFVHNSLDRDLGLVIIASYDGQYWHSFYTYYELSTRLTNANEQCRMFVVLTDGDTEWKLDFDSWDTNAEVLIFTAEDKNERVYFTINSDDDCSFKKIMQATPTTVVEVAGATPTKTLAANTYYKFTGSVTSLTLTLGTEITGITNIYAFSFVAGAANPTISLPASVTIDGTPSITAGDYVEFSIMNNVALYKIVTI